MSDIQGGMPEASGFLEPGKGSAQLVYVLYLATYVIGFTPLLGYFWPILIAGNSAP